MAAERLALSQQVAQAERSPKRPEARARSAAAMDVQEAQPRAPMQPEELLRVAALQPELEGWRLRRPEQVLPLASPPEVEPLQVDSLRLEASPRLTVFLPACAHLAPWSRLEVQDAQQPAERPLPSAA